MEGETLQETLHVCREVHVYKIPPRLGGGHKSGEWQVADRIFTGRLRITARGAACCITLEEPSGVEFASCPIPAGERAQAVEPVSDSSRYFVLRLLDPKSPNRRAFVGLGFDDRSDAFDFNVALSDHEKRLQRAQEAERAHAAAASGAAPSGQFKTDAATLYQTRDLSLREGETIKINVKRPGGTGGFLSANRGAAAPLIAAPKAPAAPLAPPPTSLSKRSIRDPLAQTSS